LAAHKIPACRSYEIMLHHREALFHAGTKLCYVNEIGGTKQTSNSNYGNSIYQEQGAMQRTTSTVHITAPRSDIKTIQICTEHVDCGTSSRAITQSQNRAKSTLLFDLDLS
jgi:hypothetical protein